MFLLSLVQYQSYNLMASRPLFPPKLGITGSSAISSCNMTGTSSTNEPIYMIDWSKPKTMLLIKQLILFRTLIIYFSGR